MEDVDQPDFNALDEWKGMPEFIQEKQRPYKQLIVRFNNEEDYQDFAQRIDQKLTPKTKSIWHPFKSHWGAPKVKYVNGA